MRIIINADDLGESKFINDEIFALMADAKISSSTIMANGPAFEDAVKRSRVYDECSFGCHLNLTEFKPLTYSQIMYDYAIVDENGFTGRLRDTKPNNSLKKALFTELKEQIIRLYDNKISISHIDSHQHIHTLPELFFVIKKIQKEFNIRKVRISMNYYGEKYNPDLLKRLKKHYWNYFFKQYYNTQTTNYFTSVDLFKNNIQHNKNKIVELMCHPGSPKNMSETQFLKTNWLKENKIQLISYNKL